MEDRHKRRVAFEERAKRMLGFLEDSEDLKVGISELKEQLETPEETFFLSCTLPNRQGMKKAKNTLIFLSKERRRCALPVWRDGTQLKSLSELERRCQGMTQEVKLLSERQEVLKGMVPAILQQKSGGKRR